MRHALLKLGGAILLACSTESALYAKSYGMAGCGLGSLLIKEDGVIQVFAATTNGTSGSQTFGISSGTSNCVTGSKAAMLQRQEEFFANNLASLSKEIAQGDGDSIKALSEQLGCSSESYDQMRTTLQSNHAYIFQAPGAIASLQRVRKTLLDQGLGSESCNSII